MKPIKIPLINPNEPEALLVSLYVNEGQQVFAGDVICTLETTKSTLELTAEGEGYIVGLRFGEGETVRANDVLGYFAESPDADPPSREPVADSGDQLASESDAPPEGLRITQPALNLAQEHGLSLDDFPLGPLVTAEMVRSRVSNAEASESEFDPTAIVIYGAGGHGKSLLDLLRALRTYRVVGFVDDGVSAGKEIMGIPVLGGGDALADLHAQGVRLAVNAVGGIGNVKVRKQVFRRIAQAGLVCPAVVHPSAVVEPGAELSAGVQVFPHAYVGSKVRIGFGSIVNTGAIVSHDCVLEDYVNLSPGAILAGDVRVGADALIGMGVTVNLGVAIGEGARVGNSATIKSDLPPNGVVPAGTIWPRD